MKKFGLQAEDPTYTALFNACSNSPWKEDGLQRAQSLREHMTKKTYTPNLTTYKAMIKAFGRCGDLQTAFALVDELQGRNLRPDEELFSMLLQACISDKEVGLRHAIEIWKRLARRKKLSLSIHHYNLLLRIIKECKIGDPILANQLLESKSHDTSGAVAIDGHVVDDIHVTLHADSSTNDKHEVNSEYSKDNMLRLESEEVLAGPETPKQQKTEFDSTDQVLPKSEEKSSWWNYTPDKTKALMDTVQQMNNIQITTEMSILDSEGPNILTYTGDLGAIVGLGDLETPQNRALLFGGLPGILKMMKLNDVKPDIKTFTQFLDLIPSSRSAEADLLAAMTVYKTVVDVDFLNLLIRRRNLRKDYKGAKAILPIIAKSDLSPNIMTYGCLAMGCPRMEDGLALLSEMEAAGIMPSVDICNILIYQAHMDFNYTIKICQTMKRLDILPGKLMISRLEYRMETARNAVVRKEKGLDVPYYAKRENFAEEFGQFMKYYKGWLLSMNLDKERHPWEQFRKPTPSNIDDLDSTISTSPGTVH